MPIRFTPTRAAAAAVAVTACVALAFAFFTGLPGDNAEAACAPAGKTQTRNWHAWNDLQPPGPHHLYVTGEVQVPDPGAEPVLMPRAPQGINPGVLMLDLHFCQAAGNWAQVMTWKPVRFETEIGETYLQVHILGADGDVALLDAEDVH